MRPVGGQALREVDPVALHPDAGHEVPPGLPEEVLAALQPVEEKVAGAGGELQEGEKFGLV